MLTFGKQVKHTHTKSAKRNEVENIHDIFESFFEEIFKKIYRHHLTLQNKSYGLLYDTLTVLLLCLSLIVGP